MPVLGSITSGTAGFNFLLVSFLGLPVKGSNCCTPVIGGKTGLLAPFFSASGKGTSINVIGLSVVEACFLRVFVPDIVVGCFFLVFVGLD